MLARNVFVEAYVKSRQSIGLAQPSSYMVCVGVGQESANTKFMDCIRPYQGQATPGNPCFPMPHISLGIKFRLGKYMSLKWDAGLHTVPDGHSASIEARIGTDMALMSPNARRGPMGLKSVRSGHTPIRKQEGRH